LALKGFRPAPSLFPPLGIFKLLLAAATVQFKQNQKIQTIVRVLIIANIVDATS